MPASYVEGRCCPLAKRGYNRDGKKGKAQIVYGLLCAADSCPVAIEVFEGNTADPKTFADLATLRRNTVATAIAPNRPFTLLTRPTPSQQKAFDLLAIPIACTQ